MTELRRSVLIVAVTGMLGAGAMVATAIAGQDAASQPATQNEKKLAAGEREAKRMLLLMDKDKNGKVSKQEFMSFMEAEFERLDVNKDGELDVKELTGSRVIIRARGR